MHLEKNKSLLFAGVIMNGKKEIK
jgi:hypothetical protein